ncbi:hypothetical protein Trco_006842 [Trichoderma cornu-damae]|uniref:Uncharacterized protein n=1 Tax=Trichoderma cornu-damae TaxID=654480 RepID=A0A9P8QFP9_9HYPO|nr:hypothetical protein Trco_006842 [Trichoderma cornu-damae]
MSLRGLAIIVPEVDAGGEESASCLTGVCFPVVEVVETARGGGEEARSRSNDVGDEFARTRAQLEVQNAKSGRRPASAVARDGGRNE